MNEHDVYEKGRTDQAGTVGFSVSTASPDSLLLTVTAPNHSHHQTRIPVVTEGVLLELVQTEILDRDDGKVNPGEVPDLGLTIKNYGTDPDSGVWGILRATDASCTIIDSMVYFGSVPAGAEVVGLTSPAVEFDSSLANGASVLLELSLVDSTANQWTARIPLVVATPLFSVSSYGIDDSSGGDGDFVAEPDESLVLTLEIYNSGLTYDAVQVSLTSLDAYVAIVDSVTGSGDICAGCAGYSLHRATIDLSCPVTHVARLLASVETLRGFTFEDTVYFTVGELCFADDCESGEGSWTYNGLWHLSSYRSHSDSMSWYFGDEGTHRYPSNSGGKLVSQGFIAGEDNRLSFWFWHNFTTYGVDGVYVIVMANGVPDTMDFIGSGGALDGSGQAPLGIFTDWVKWDRVLEDVAPGDSLTFKFTFDSDNFDVAEGMYIDDIAFSCKTAGQSGTEEPAATKREISLSLFPNPVHNEVTISFGGSRKAVSIDIFGVDGRFVTHLEKPAGAATLNWDLRDMSGRRVAPGIYVARTEGESESQSIKLVILR
jgi:hypothetical protein